MWVIHTQDDGETKIYLVGFRDMNYFEIFDTFEDKLEAMKCCHYLNGGS